MSLYELLWGHTYCNQNLFLTEYICAKIPESHCQKVFC